MEPEFELIARISGEIIFGVIMLFPTWKIYAKAGKKPALSLFILVPFIGFWIVILILAFSRWPATENNQPEGDKK